MSFHKASVERRLAHRAATPGATAPGAGGDGGEDGNPGNGTGDTGAGKGQGNTTSSSSSTTADTTSSSSPSSPPAQPTDNTTTSSQSSSSSSQTTSSSSSSSSTTPTSSNTPTSSSSSTESSTTSKTSSTLSSTSPSPSLSTVTSTHLSTFTPTDAIQSSSFASVSRTFSTTSISAADSSSSPKPSGAINTGAIVGGIAGGLAGLALLGFLAACILRRINRKKRAQRFEAAQFRRSAMVLDDENFATPRPPEMIQNRANNYTNSVTSSTGPGMAGAGAYRFQQETGPGNNFENEHEYYREQASQQYHDESPAVPMQRAPLQPRQQYTFGQVPVENTQAAAENANPFVVDDYDGEAHQQAYGNYTAYSPQTQHTAGAHPSGHLAAKSLDESDAYGGI